MARKSKQASQGGEQAVTHWLGVDIAKATFDVALSEANGGIVAVARFDNTEAGFKALHKWLVKRKVWHVHVCMEATGRYGEGLAHYLHAKGYPVSVVNPQRIHAYGQSKLQRNKTDAQDARLIADFCRTQQPDLWTPPAPEQHELQLLTRRLETLKHLRQQELNRAGAGELTPDVDASIATVLAVCDAEIARLERKLKDLIAAHPDLKHKVDLLDSIPGVGQVTACILLAEIPDLDTFTSASQLAAYAGLSPSLHSSGTSVERKPRLSKQGNAHIRSALYMPAMSLLRANSPLRQFADRLQLKGKTKMAIMGALMHKIIRYAYAVLKHDMPFDRNYDLTAQVAQIAS